MKNNIRWLRDFTFKKWVTLDQQWAEYPKPIPLSTGGEFSHVFKAGSESFAHVAGKRLVITGIGTIEDAIEGEDFELISVE